VLCLIRSVQWNEERAKNAARLVARIPDARIHWDDEHDSYQAMINCLRLAGNDACLHMEDDVTLTTGFVAKLRAAVHGREDEVHQFYSMRKRDLTEGTRLIPGRDFSSTCCVYLPAGMADAADHLEAWPKRAEHPTWFDYALADYLASKRLNYRNHVPSLVQHNKWKSAIDRRRGTTNRNSPSFDP
jgi:hypothetical protein